MKQTKKQIYAKYGIEYANGKIKTPLGWMCELLKEGNSKVGKKVKTWSMNQTTCKCHCNGCYGDSGFYNMPNVKKSLDRNTQLAREYTEFFRRALFAQLETLPAGTEIRIHALGDFFNNEYSEVWQDAVRKFTQLIFWTYTKRTEYETLFDELPNGNIVKSMINGKYNFGHCDYILNTYQELQSAGESVYICRCGIDDRQHCQGCHMCSSSKYVLFIEHSTGYNAKKDPLFNTLAEVIDNQQEGR